MYDVEKISSVVARKMASLLQYDKDHEEVLAYGAFSILQTVNTVFYIILVGFLFKVPLEAFIASCAASVLRKYSGGVHASTPNRCALLGVIAFVGMGAIAKGFNSISYITAILVAVLCLGIAYIIVAKRAPVDTPNKPITDPVIQKDLRGKALRALHIYGVIIVALIFLNGQGLLKEGWSILLAISFGTLWQSFTLTKAGKAIITYFDYLLGKANLWDRR